MEARVGRLVTALTGAFLVAVAVGALVAPRPGSTAYRQPVVVVLTLALLAVALLWRPPAWLRRAAGTRWAAPAVALLAGGVGLVVGMSLVLRWSWDVGVVNGLARALYAGEPLREGQASYLSRYPNTHVLVDLHRTGYWLAERTEVSVRTLLLALVAAAAALTVLLVHTLVAPVVGRVRAVAAQVVVVALVATSPWMAVPYTDVLAMPLVTGAVVLAVRASRRRDRWGAAQLVASAALTALAIALKTTPVVLVVAVGALGLVIAVDLRRRWRDALVVLAGTAVWAVLALGGAVAVASASTHALGDVPLRAEASPPVLWWVANGMTTTTFRTAPPRYGGYNGPMVAAIAGMDREEATQWSSDRVEDQWRRRGPGGLAAFYVDKAVWNWGDGMFWAWGEGRDGRPETLAPPRHTVAGVVHEVDSRRGSWYPLRSDLAQALWLTVVVVAGVGAVRRRGPPREVVLTAVTVLGIAAFTLVFQGRSRYLLSFVPLVVALAAFAPRGPRLRSATPRLSWFRRSGAARS